MASSTAVTSVANAGALTYSGGSVLLEIALQLLAVAREHQLRHGTRALGGGRIGGDRSRDQLLLRRAAGRGA
jgi:hypothetical protein